MLNNRNVFLILEAGKSKIKVLARQLSKALLLVWGWPLAWCVLTGPLLCVPWRVFSSVSSHMDTSSVASKSYPGDFAEPPSRPWYLRGNRVGFVISKEEDLTLGSGTRLDHSRAFVQQSFIKVWKGTEKASDIDIRKGWRAPPALDSLSKGVKYF